MRSSTNFRIQQGYDSEAIVTSLLPSAVHMNGEDESRLPYDVLWNDIRIDVKSSGGIHFNRTWLKKNDSNDVVLVYICMGGDTYFFWVRHLSGQGGITYGNPKTRLTAEQLPQAIIDCHKLYSPVYKKTVDNMLTVE